MTYCVAMNLDAGMIFASDSRTNAGVDQIARFSKMRIFARDGHRVIVTLSSGNLSITQNALNTLDQRARSGDNQLHLWNAASMFDVARLIGDAVREVKGRDGAYLAQNNIDSSAHFLVGGQIRGEPPRLFEVYTEGNFIEATPDTCYFQIGELQVRQAGHRPRRQPRHVADRRHQVHAGVVRLDDAVQHFGRPADRPPGVRNRFAADPAAAPHRRRPIRISRWSTRNGVKACARCSPSCPTPSGADGRRPSNCMAIRVALQHRTSYRFDRPVTLSPHEIRLRPAPHCRHADPRLFVQRLAEQAFPELAAGSLRQLGGAAGVHRAGRPPRRRRRPHRRHDGDQSVRLLRRGVCRAFPVHICAGAGEGTDSVPRDCAARAAARRLARPLSRARSSPAKRPSTCWSA